MTVICPQCAGEKVYRHGVAKRGLRRYRCAGCRHCFQLEYVYNANKVEVREQIIEMAMNGSGVRDTSRVLKISQNTVMAHLKNSTHRV